MESKARVTIKGYDRPHLRKGSKCLGLVVHKGLCKRCKGLAFVASGCEPGRPGGRTKPPIIIATRSHVDRDFTEGGGMRLSSHVSLGFQGGARNQSSAI